MPTELTRFHHTGGAHFITFSYFRKRPILGSPKARDKLLEIIEQARQTCRCHVLGYVVMRRGLD